MLLQGDPPIPVRLRRSARARRMTLRVSRLDGQVTLTVPRGVPEADAAAFADDRADWIRRHIDQHLAPVEVREGAQIPIRGLLRVVRTGAGRRVLLEQGAVCVPGDPARSGRRLGSWLRQLARDDLAAASDRYAATLGRDYDRLALRDTRSRWGSCSSAGRLMFSWRLVMAPPEVLAYVAAHEVAHLAEMNHSPAFWATVARIHGDFAAPRAWLRCNGHTLHRYRFGDAGG